MRPAVVLGVGLAALVLLPRRAHAYALPEVPEASDELLLDVIPDPWAGFEWDELLYPIPDEVNIVMPETASPRIEALLYAIRRSEHLPSDVAADRDWRVFYGGSTFTGMQDHPALTGEKRGIRLPDEWCIAAGFSPGCVSTAAGAFQINVPTWRRVRAAGAWGPRLPDFTPASQREAALRLIREKGADLLAEAGDVTGAIYALAPIWASLPRSQARQPVRSIEDVLAYYAIGLDAAAGFA